VTTAIISGTVALATTYLRRGQKAADVQVEQVRQAVGTRQVDRRQAADLARSGAAAVEPPAPAVDGAAALVRLTTELDSHDQRLARIELSLYPGRSPGL